MSILKKLKNLKKIKDPIVIILGDYPPTSLGVIRSLGRKKIPILFVDPNPRNTGFLSKYCIGVTCPNPINEEYAYIDFLEYIGQYLHVKGILMPIADIELSLISKHRSSLEKYYRFPFAPNNVIMQILNKQMFYKMLEKEGIPHPVTFFPNSSSDLKDIGKNITYPCIVKPVFSSLFVKDFQMKVLVAKSIEELKVGYNRAMAKNHAMMIQEIIPGGVKEMHGFNTYYNRNHIPIGKFMYRRIREWPHNYGNGCLIENIQLPDLEEIITPLIKKIKYYGIVDVEFKKDYRDGLFKIIEINTRFWMQNSFPTRCGINLPYMAYCDAVNISIKKPLLTKEKIKWLYLSDDIRSSLKSMRNRTLSLHDWMLSYQGKKEYALFAKDDPLPFFDAYRKNMLLAFPYIFKSLKKNN